MYIVATLWIAVGDGWVAMLLVVSGQRRAVPTMILWLIMQMIITII